ncbi:MAG: hypothetical protein GY722_01625 [bacterium]|nr:hypothetical protein [bacterium]
MRTRIAFEVILAALLGMPGPASVILVGVEPAGKAIAVHVSIRTLLAPFRQRLTWIPLEIATFGLASPESRLNVGRSKLLDGEGGVAVAKRCLMEQRHPTETALLDDVLVEDGTIRRAVPGETADGGCSIAADVPDSPFERRPERDLAATAPRTGARRILRGSRKCPHHRSLSAKQRHP